MCLSCFNINTVLLSLIMVGKGQESLPFPKIPLNEHVDFGKNETQKEIWKYTIYYYFLLHGHEGTGIKCPQP